MPPQIGFRGFTPYILYRISLSQAASLRQTLCISQSQISILNGLRPNTEKSLFSQRDSQTLLIYHDYPPCLRIPSTNCVCILTQVLPPKRLPRLIPVASCSFVPYTVEIDCPGFSPGSFKQAFARPQFLLNFILFILPYFTKNASVICPFHSIFPIFFVHQKYGVCILHNSTKFAV